MIVGSHPFCHSERLELNLKKIPVTVILPVKNDAKALPQALEKLGRFQKVVVVDSDSKDGTDEVAAAYGAEYVIFRWNGQPPKKRSWYLDNHDIETDWVLFLDADEIVSDAFCDEVENSIAKHDHVGFWMTFHNWFMGKWLRHGDPFSKLALFKHAYGRYERVADDGWTNIDVEVHEHPVLDGTLGESIHRLPTMNVVAWIPTGKHNEYSTRKPIDTWHWALKVRANGI